MKQKEISGRLQELIKDLQLKLEIKNQSEFVRRIGYDIASMSKVLSGERNLPQDKLDKILTEFHVSKIWLFQGEGKMYSYNIAPKLSEIEFLRELTISQQKTIYNMSLALSSQKSEAT